MGLTSGLPSLAQNTVPAAVAVVAESSGTVTVQIGDGPPQPFKPGQPLQLGMIISIGPASSAVLVFPDGQVCALGEGSVFRIISYVFDPRDSSKNQVSLNLIDGSMRIVMGEIGQTNPSAVRVQIGTATLGVVPSQSATTDASVVVQGGPVAVVVQEGRVEVRLPTGQPQEISAGQGMYMGLDGSVRRGAIGQIIQQLSQSPQGADAEKQLAVLQGFSQKLAQTVITLATVTSAVKNLEASESAQRFVENALAAEILKQLASLPPTAQVSSPQSTPPLVILIVITPQTGAGGGSPVSGN